MTPVIQSALGSLGTRADRAISWLSSLSAETLTLGLLGALALAILVRLAIAAAHQPRSNSSLETGVRSYWLFGVPLLALLYSLDSAAYVRRVVPAANALLIRGLWDGSDWSFTYANASTSKNRLVAPKGRPVQLLLSATRGTKTMRIGCKGPMTEAIAGRYTSLSFEATRAENVRLCCGSDCDFSRVVPNRVVTKTQLSPRPPAHLAVLETAEFNRWLDEASRSNNSVAQK